MEVVKTGPSVSLSLDQLVAVDMSLDRPLHLAMSYHNPALLMSTCRLRRRYISLKNSVNVLEQFGRTSEQSAIFYSIFVLTLNLTTDLQG